MSKTPLRVVVTGAAGQISYSLLGLIAKGDVFGTDQPIDLVMLDLSFAEAALGGVVMELQDCAFPLVNSLTATCDQTAAFTDIDVAVLVGAFPRRPGMERKDMLEKNAEIFQAQGKLLDTVAKKTVKVLVVGNPANTNALIASTCAPSIPKENFSALTRLDQNRATSQIAMKSGVTANKVEKVTIWGNHSATQYPDAWQATVEKDGKSVSASEAVNDDAWLKGDFITTVQKRGAAVLEARKLSSAMSAAKAIGDHLRDWICGSNGRWVSMAVNSTGNTYSIPEGLIYSFPVTCEAGKWTPVTGLTISDFSREKLTATANELAEEKQFALEFLKIA
jgi:malate dehydrogenase